jgi:EAL domain-containing protein (putative c-di-GMP-specific phosphodiesterase class I)
VIEQACRQLAAWRAAHPASAAGMTMSINLSRRQLGDARLIPHLRRVLEQTRIGPASVRMEITESVIMDGIDAAGDILGRIKQTGVELSMDDFGTGYSSLSYLSRFPVDILKMDRSFLRSGHYESGLAAAILALGETLELEVVAEGIELPNQAAALRDLGCDLGQGFLFAPAMPWALALDYLQAGPQAAPDEPQADAA